MDGYQIVSESLRGAAAFTAGSGAATGALSFASYGRNLALLKQRYENEDHPKLKAKLKDRYLAFKKRGRLKQAGLAGAAGSGAAAAGYASGRLGRRALSKRVFS